MIARFFIRLNNAVTRLRCHRVESDHLLLLVPSCLQRTGCGQSIGETIDDCNACGQCNVTDLLALRDEFGIRCSMAAGGREALAFVADRNIRAVVAVACEKELIQGILAVFPKPVLGVVNIQTDGPCRNTRMDIGLVREAVRTLLERHPGGGSKP